MMYGNFLFSHVVYQAYLAHRRKNRPNEPGGARRLYPSFKTSGGQIIPPDDVMELAIPIFSQENRHWAGREVTQLRRGGETEYYVGM